MQKNEKNKGRELFIVDSSDHEWKVQCYLKEQTGLVFRFEIVTGYSPGASHAR